MMKAVLQYDDWASVAVTSEGRAIDDVKLLMYEIIERDDEDDCWSRWY